MSMLAENRRKSKWVVNPTKKPIWSTDSNGIKFGKQLMEKMGWSAGKGLGLNEQGIQEPLKVSFKNDTKGMGFKGNDDDWIEHQDEFNMLLNQLRSGDDSAVNGSVESNEIKSLEEKSKQSKARVHYQKFTRGKDLSKYSENDLACILGTGKSKKKDKSKTEEVTEVETKTNGNFETSFGVTTINSGSINDYFKKKWMVKPSGSAIEADEDREENFRPSFSCGNSGFSVNDDTTAQPVCDEKNASQKHKSMAKMESSLVKEEEMPELDETINSERIDKKKRKKQGIEINLEQEEPERKKRKKSSIDNSCLEGLSRESESLLLHSEKCGNSEGEKRKDKHHDASDIFADNVELKRGRKKSKTNIEDIFSGEPEQINDASNGRIAEEESIKKKKKKKKEKTDEKEVIESRCINDIQLELSNEDMNASCLTIESVKNKKKKKEKLDKSKGIDNNIEDIHMKNQDTEKTEKCNDVCQSENSMDVELCKKKKKKKDKKEKLQDCVDNSLEVHCSDKKKSKSLEVVVGEEVNEGENGVELKSVKKKKKSKKEKLDENNEIINGSIQAEESSLQDMASEKTIGSCEKETTSDYESLKRKKKKKDKKEKHKQIECKDKEYCFEEEKTEQCILEEELIEKKKKKKHKREKGDSEGAENMEDQGGEKTGKKVDLSVHNNEVNGVLNTKTEGQDRLQKLRGSLFPDKAADKYFPEQGTNERVLKLIRWANIEEFKGSNLSDVEGYGRRITHQKQSR